MNAQHLQLHVAHHEIYTKKTVLFIGKNRQRSCIANFEATLSMRSSNASTRRHQCTLSVRFFPFSEATPKGAWHPIPLDFSEDRRNGCFMPLAACSEAVRVFR